MFVPTRIFIGIGIMSFIMILAGVAFVWWGVASNSFFPWMMIAGGVMTLGSAILLFKDEMKVIKYTTRLKKE